MVEKMTTANELKPCGCGNVNIDVGQRKRVGYKRFTAKCLACHTQTTPLNTMEKAVRAWNNAMSGPRAPQPEPLMREALQALADAADAVGVAFFDTDTFPPEVQAMQSATLRARTLLSTPPAQPAGEREWQSIETAPRDAIAEALKVHWVTSYGCDPEPRHTDRTRVHCWCGWSSGKHELLGGALQEFVQHVLAAIDDAAPEALPGQSADRVKAMIIWVTKTFCQRYGQLGYGSEEFTNALAEGFAALATPSPAGQGEAMLRGLLSRAMPLLEEYCHWQLVSEIQAALRASVQPTPPAEVTLRPDAKWHSFECWRNWDQTHKCICGGGQSLGDRRSDEASNG